MQPAGSQERTFRMSFGDGLWTAAGFAAGGIIAFGLSSLAMGPLSPTVFIALAVAWAGAAVWQKRRVSITSSYIQSASGNSILWRDIDRAAFVGGPFGGLSVRCCAGRAFLIAPSIARHQEFRAALFAVAPPDSPIVKALSARHSARV